MLMMNCTRRNYVRFLAGSFLAIFGAAFPAPAATATKEPKAAAVSDGKIHWVDNFANAKKTASAESKDLLIDFTGSDWCGWCIRLHEEVFDQPAFQVASKEFVFVELDFPNQKPQSAAIKQQNAKLKEEFAIEGYPSIFLADATGRPYAQTGYQKGGPEKYLAHLAELKKVKSQRDDAFAAADKASGVERARQLAKGLDAMDSELVVHHYVAVVAEISKLDPADESGATGKYGFQIDLAAANAKLSALKGGAGAAEARQAMDKFLEAHPKADNGQKQAALFNVLNYCRAPKDNEFVVKLMDEVEKIDPSSQVGKSAAAIRNRVQPKAKPSPVTPSKGAIDASNLEAIAAAKGKSVLVEGEVAATVPTTKGGHLNIELAPAGSGLMVFVRQQQLEALNKMHDGDFAKAINHHRVQVRGTVENYGGKDSKFKGRLQISLSAASQIDLIKENTATPPSKDSPAAPTTAPADGAGQ